MKCDWVDHVMVVNLDGYTRPCCQASSNDARISHISSGIKNAWSSKKLEFLRDELVVGYTDNIKNICSRCSNAESLGVSSLRMVSDFFPGDETNALRGIQFKLSNRCQLTCAHCEPYLSSSWGKLKRIPIFIQDAVKKDDQDKLIDELIELLPTLSWIKFTGGEPWMDPFHWKILEKLSTVNKSNCELHYITNGLASFDSALWKGWKSVNITLSVDGHEETYEWFRRGSDWAKLIKVVNELNQLDVKLHISYCISPWTVVDWERANNFWKVPISPQPVMIPWHSSLISLNHNDINLPSATPFINLIGQNPVDITKLKDWAVGWDATWDTSGWAEKIHPWVFEC